MTDIYSTGFDEIVAAFHEYPRCEEATFAGVRCQRVARWRINTHGCEQANLCGHHKSHWERRTRADLRVAATVRCGLCGAEFTCFDDAIRIVGI